jgi:ubiquinol-cytochrome c reductase cytochrome c1 subunit
MRKTIFSLGLAAVIGLVAPAVQASEGTALPKLSWSFSAPFGTYDRGALQRGFQVYKEVCAACHSMNLLAYRDLTDLGYNEAEVKAIAAQYEVTDGPNDQGEMFQRPAVPSDRFKAPFPNVQAAKAANNGAAPPDLSLMAKARIGGPDYIHALMIGYENAPAGFAMQPGLNYNKYFPGNQIAMPAPINPDGVTFADGTKATVDQQARDVSHFLMWAAEPKLEQRHRMGAQVILFLLILSVVLFIAKRKIWSDVH